MERLWRTTLILVLFASVFVACDATYNNTCLIDPTNPSCANFILPSSEVENDINGLCKMMGNMTGCSVNRICVDPRFGSGLYCTRFSILMELCNDMQMGSYCNAYQSMCVSGTAIKECETKYLPFPKSKEMVGLIQNICSDMDMAGCEQCTGKGSTPCDVLVVYSQLCQSMPDMNQCSDWNNICALVPSWPICSQSGGTFPPEMRMYFHSGIMDYVLFKNWVPRTDLEYAGTWVAIFLMAVLFDVFRLIKQKLEQQWVVDVDESETSESNASSINTPQNCHEELEPLSPSSRKESRIPPFRLQRDLLRGVLSFLETGWSLALMLVAMTFNIGLFLALCAGAGVSALLFGRFLFVKSKHH